MGVRLVVQRGLRLGYAKGTDDDGMASLHS